MPKYLQTQRAFLFILTFLFSTNLIFGQADLVVSTAGFQPNSIAKGDIFNIQATVTNIGNVTAGANYMFIYYTDDLTVDDSEIISRVSIKELAPNESQDINFIYPIPFIDAGDYFIALGVDPFDNVSESDENNIFCSPDGNGNCATFSITNSVANYQKFTYPIIFIHGWTSNSETWNEFTNDADLYYGWNFGGRLNYCLNPDGNQSISNNTITIFNDATDLNVGDYYYVNFDVSTNGDLFVNNDGIPFNDDYSNQSAIVRQGFALQHAIEQVLSTTGAEKVILVGHSMGGLASREYLQNPINWQSDGNHHVAKIFTIGTPHGGSNTSFANLGTFIGKDEKSEAVRDLRSPSLVFGGQYLFGGTEDFSLLFHNNDVNCNLNGGDEITGLNEKISPNDVNYSCLIGDLPLIDGDGVVEVNNANFNNFLLAQPPLAMLNADRFDVSSSHTSIHTDSDNHSLLIRGLDEPSNTDLAYSVPLNSLNFGYSTIQAENNPIPPPNNVVDFDSYKIEVTENGLLEVFVNSIPVNSFALFLLNEDLELLEEVQALGESNIQAEYQVTPGTYHIRLGSIPTSNSWSFPYAYTILFTSESGLVADFSSNTQEGCKPFNVNFSNQSTGSPTEYLWTFQGGTPSTSTSQNPSVIYNEAGIYPVSLIISNDVGSTNITKNGFITVNSTPDADFSFANIADNTVTFTNETQFDIALPNYSWDFGDNETSSQVSPTHTYGEDGVYAVELMATNNCGNSNTTKSVDIMTVGTNGVNVKSTVLIYPNPSEGIFNVKVEGSTIGDYQLTLLNNLGQVLKLVEVKKTVFLLEYQLNAADLPSGNYFVRIDSESENQVMRIVKE